MNNKSLSIIVILCTMISVCVMLVINQDENPKFNNKSYIMLHKNNNLENISSNYDKKSSDDSSNFEKDISNMQKNDIKKEYNNDNEDESNKNLESNNNLNKNYTKVDKCKEISINETYENSEKYEYTYYDKYTYYENKYKKADQKDIPVFKVSTDVIKKELSFRDKQKLFFMASKLSPFDFGRIKRDLYCPDAEEGVKDALMLAKERLSKMDYEKLKDILDEYINMEAIEKESYQGG